jgi:apolipoprotein N-acyltransferase
MAPPGTLPFLALICYEAIFSGDLGADIAKAGFILNITNDAWFDGSIGPAQHAHHVRLRAVEEGLSLVRVANSGITMLVDPLGRVTARLAEQQAALMDVSPAERLPSTIFAQYRHWPFLVLEIFGLLIALASRRRRRRKA